MIETILLDRLTTRFVGLTLCAIDILMSSRRDVYCRRTNRSSQRRERHTNADEDPAKMMEACFKMLPIHYLFDAKRRFTRQQLAFQHALPQSQFVVNESVRNALSHEVMFVWFEFTMRRLTPEGQTNLLGGAWCWMRDAGTGLLGGEVMIRRPPTGRNSVGAVENKPRPLFYIAPEGSSSADASIALIRRLMISSVWSEIEKGTMDSPKICVEVTVVSDPRSRVGIVAYPPPHVG